MTTYTEQTAKFLDSKKALKGMDKELAQALIKMLGGEQSFLDSLIDSEKTSMLHQVKIFGESNKAIVMRFYELNHQSFLNFATAKSYKEHKGSMITYVKSLFQDDPSVMMNSVAKSLHRPTYLATAPLTETIRRDIDCTYKVATALYFQGVVHLTECYCEFLSGNKHKYNKGFMFALEYDKQMKSKEPLATLIMNRFDGGYDDFVANHESLVGIDMSDNVAGFEDTSELVNFFETNKGNILALVKRIGGADQFSGMIGAVHYHVKDKNFTLEDVGRGLFEPVKNKDDYTNLKADIARAAVNLSIKAVAQDYKLYVSKEAA